MRSNKMTKKEKLRAMYIAAYVILIAVVTIYAMVSPEYWDSVMEYIDKIYKAFGLFLS